MATGLLEQRTPETADGDTGGRDHDRSSPPSGEAVAALLAAMLGMLTLALVNQVAEISPAFTAWLHRIGKLWMPGAAGIGPYSGKETLAAAAWLLSWVVLQPALRARRLALSHWLIVFLIGVAVATTLIWPPMYVSIGHYLAGH